MKARHALLTLAAAAVALAAGRASAVELHGYLRTGVGGNGEGGNQVCWLTAPLGYKFRLGNECETYAEVELRDSLYRDKSGLQFNYYTMVHYKTGGLRNAEPLNRQDTGYVDGSGGVHVSPTNEFAFRQLWVEAKGVPFLGGASVWAGNRYYRRNDLHILDFFYWDASGPGIGVEDVDLGGFAKLAVAILQSKGGWGLGYDRVDKVAIWKPDIRVYGIGLPGSGNLEVGLQLAMVSGRDYSPDTQRVSPWVTVQHFQPVFGGFNKLALQWAQGTIAPMTAYPEPQNGKDAKRFRIVEQLVVQPVKKFSGMLAFVYEDVRHQYGGTGPYNSFKSYSIGARPVFHVNDFFKLQLEAGTQWFKPNDAPRDAGQLTQVSFAPTISPPPGPGGSFFVRRELRVFVTWAKWNDAEAGFLQTWNAVYYSSPTGGGGPPAVFGTKTDGFTFGAQVEAWW
jgi:maltoporin